MADKEYERLAKDGLGLMIEHQNEMMDRMLKKQERHDKVILMAVIIFAVVVIAGIYVIWRLDDNNVFMQILWALENCRNMGVIG